MNSLTWTMNCVLFGAKIIKLIREDKEIEAVAEVKNLSSEFDDTSARYLVERLKNLDDDKV